jgi:hypothetical protein
MLVFEFKTYGKSSQFTAVDEAIAVSTSNIKKSKKFKEQRQS